MSNHPTKSDAHQLQHRLAVSDAEMRRQWLPDGHCAVRNRARAMLREVPEQGEP